MDFTSGIGDEAPEMAGQDATMEGVGTVFEEVCGREVVLAQEGEGWAGRDGKRGAVFGA